MKDDFDDFDAFLVSIDSDKQSKKEPEMKEIKTDFPVYTFNTGNLFPVNDRSFAVDPEIKDKDTAVDVSNSRIDYIEKICSLEYAYHFGKLDREGNLTLMKKMGCKTPYDVWQKISQFKKHFVKTKIGFRSINTPVCLYKSQDKSSWIIELERGVFTTLKPRYTKAMDAILGC